MGYVDKIEDIGSAQLGITWEPAMEFLNELTQSLWNKEPPRKRGGDERLIALMDSTSIWPTKTSISNSLST